MNTEPKIVLLVIVLCIIGMLVAGVSLVLDVKSKIELRNAEISCILSGGCKR